MSLPRRVAATVTGHTRLVLAMALLATALLGAGIPMIDADVDLEEITGDSSEARANGYVDENFTAAGGENTTAVLLVRTGNDTLTRASLLESLRLQQRIRGNRSINRTLVEDDPITGLETVVAIAAIGKRLEDRGDRLAERADELNATTERLEAGLDEIRALQREFENDTAGLNESDPAYREREARLEADVAAVIDRVTESLDDGQRYSYTQSADIVRRSESQLVELTREYGANASGRTSYTQTELAIEEEYTWATLAIREAEFGRLSRRADRLEEEADELEADRPPLAEQIAALREPNLTRSEYRDVVRDTLNGTGPRSSDVLRLVASSYRIDTATAPARMTVLTQRTSGEGGLEMGVTNETLIGAQRTLRDLATGDDPTTAADTENATADTPDDGRYVVFGSGLVEHEIDESIADTLAIVTPLALVLVVLALSVAYRDPLDILLGLTGIAVVLVWTFGVMGWAGIPFNVLLVAVPVLLIGISIDFAVHVLMRHREHRTPAAPEDPPGAIRPAMTAAIGGVGVALFWAAATTVIGFFANVVSPLGLIRQFGLASGVGIASALLVFTTLVPALKIELDELLERVGLDRHRRAFGTTGRLAGALAIGATAARRAPLLVVALLLVVTAVSGAAATGVDTTFQIGRASCRERV